MSELRRITKADIVLAIISLMGLEPKTIAEYEALKKELQSQLTEPTREKEPIYTTQPEDSNFRY